MLRKEIHWKMLKYTDAAAKNTAAARWPCEKRSKNKQLEQQFLQAIMTLLKRWCEAQEWSVCWLDDEMCRVIGGINFDCYFHKRIFLHFATRVAWSSQVGSTLDWRWHWPVSCYQLAIVDLLWSYYHFSECARILSLSSVAAALFE